MEKGRKLINRTKDWLSYHTPTERHLSGGFRYYWKLFGPMAFLLAVLLIVSRI